MCFFSFTGKLPVLLLPYFLHSVSYNIMNDIIFIYAIIIITPNADFWTRFFLFFSPEFFFLMVRPDLTFSFTHIYIYISF